MLNYSFAGLAASCVAGALVVLSGDALVPFPVPARAIVVPIAMIGALREALLLPIPLLQPRRQTSQHWKVYGRPRAALAWGFDLGLVFTTRFTFSGTWAVVALALVSHDIAEGIAFFCALWLGRVASIWLAPALLAARPSDVVVRGLSARSRILQIEHAIALVWIAVFFSPLHH